MHHYNMHGYSHAWTMVWLFRIAFSQPEISTDKVTYNLMILCLQDDSCADMYMYSISIFLGVCTCTLCIRCTTVTSHNLYKISCMLTVSQLQAQYKHNYSLHQRIHMHIMPGILEQYGQSRYVHAHLQRLHMAVWGTSHQVCYCLHS